MAQLNPVSYCWQEDPNGAVDHGFIAQDIQKLFPQSVQTVSDHLRINYNVMFIYMLMTF